MKKSIRNIITTYSVLALVASMAIPVSAKDTGDIIEAYKDLSNYPVAAIVDEGQITVIPQVKESSSVSLYDDLLSCIDDNQYGGAYVNEEGKMIIGVPNGQESILVTALQYYEDMDNIQYRPVKYTMDELIEAKNFLINERESFSFHALGINEQENTVNVYTSEITDVERQAILQSVPVDISFIIEPNNYDDMSSVSCGNKAAQSSNAKNYASIACGLKWDKSTSPRYGFLTAGHFVEQIWNAPDVTVNETKMGFGSGYSIGGQYDWGLLYRTDSSFKTTNQLIDGTKFEYTGGSCPVGGTVKMYGSTSGVTSGIVKDSNYWYTNGPSFTNMVLTTASVAKGDSGGSITYQGDKGKVLTGLVKGAQNGNLIYSKLAPTLDKLDASVFIES